MRQGSKLWTHSETGVTLFPNLSASLSGDRTLVDGECAFDDVERARTGGGEVRCFGVEMFLNEEFVTVGDETEEIKEEIVVWFL